MSEVISRKDITFANIFRNLIVSNATRRDRFGNFEHGIFIRSAIPVATHSRNQIDLFLIDHSLFIQYVLVDVDLHHFTDDQISGTATTNP